MNTKRQNSSKSYSSSSKLKEHSLDDIYNYIHDQMSEDDDALDDILSKENLNFNAHHQKRYHHQQRHRKQESQAKDQHHGGKTEQLQYHHHHIQREYPKRRKDENLTRKHHDIHLTHSDDHLNPKKRRHKSKNHSNRSKSRYQLDSSGSSDIGSLPSTPEMQSRHYQSENDLSIDSSESSANATTSDSIYKDYDSCDSGSEQFKDRRKAKYYWKKLDKIQNIQHLINKKRRLSEEKRRKKMINDERRKSLNIMKSMLRMNAQSLADLTSSSSSSSSHSTSPNTKKDTEAKSIKLVKQKLSSSLQMKAEKQEKNGKSSKKSNCKSKYSMEELRQQPKHYRPVKRTRDQIVHWHPTEVGALQIGIDRHQRKWTTIKQDPDLKDFLQRRTTIDLKDKFRSMIGTIKRKTNKGLPLPPWCEYVYRLNHEGVIQFKMQKDSNTMWVNLPSPATYLDLDGENYGVEVMINSPQISSQQNQNDGGSTDEEVDSNDDYENQEINNKFDDSSNEHDGLVEEDQQKGNMIENEKENLTITIFSNFVKAREEITLKVISTVTIHQLLQHAANELFPNRSPEDFELLNAQGSNLGCDALSNRTVRSLCEDFDELQLVDTRRNQIRDPVIML